MFDKALGDLEDLQNGDHKNKVDDSRVHNQLNEMKELLGLSQ